VNVNLCYRDAYAKEAETRVAAVDDASEAPLVVLETTVCPAHRRRDRP
jgi:hypothetical protein